MDDLGDVPPPGTESQPRRKDEPSLPTKRDLYSHGSEFCKHYSKETMTVRTLAQHVMLGYAVAVGLAASRLGEAGSWPPDYLGWVLGGGGAILCIFAVVLWTLNQHFSWAFRRIRDRFLIAIEEEAAGLEIGSWKETPDTPACRPPGPWAAHEMERRTRKIGPLNAGTLAWRLPFLAMLFVGIVSIVAGVYLLGIQKAFW